MMTSTTKIMLNETDLERCNFPLETKLRALAQSLVILPMGIFDCCRVESKLCERGVIHDDSKASYIFMHGCPPAKTVFDTSSLLHDFFDFIEQKSDKYG